MFAENGRPYRIPYELVAKKPTLHAKKRQRFTQVDRIAGPFQPILIQKIIEFPWKRAYPVK